MDLDGFSRSKFAALIDDILAELEAGRSLEVGTNSPR